jgi:hypothetical protein
MTRKSPALTLPSLVLARPLLWLEAAAVDLGRAPLDAVAVGTIRGAAEAMAEIPADAAMRVDRAALLHLKARLLQAKARLACARTSS